MGTARDATGPAEQPDEPRVEWSGFNGLRVGPRQADSVVPRIASSGHAVFATNTSPARRRRAIASLSWSGTKPSRNRVDAVHGWPFTKPSKSLTTMGTPRNGPSGSGPAAVARAR